MKKLTANQKWTGAITFNRIAEMRKELNSGGPYWLKNQIRQWIGYAKDIRLSE